ncbi:hypothetical protein DFR41_10572 [Pseudacidovorax intermedius]|uniref:RidA family protein n=1 Tax=Pseudacidovorax intermedius TaxID=433924 RepID=A0A370FIW3_9BURK|nr:hypothetical protein [Pseudacidovorax intermedius]RDI24157.1 hypothetical protein DFR41_10572 [Pseudacidovorax intermedius]
MTMPSTISVPQGGFRYLPGGFQYSAAVVAEPGFVIERAVFDAALPLEEGFARIEAHLRALGRPMAALCACELRSPAPLTEADFVSFNRRYVQPLEQWGIYLDGANPVARCNLVPADRPPKTVVFHAFSYTRPTAVAQQRPDFVTSGAAECPDRPGYRDAIVRLGETSPDALCEKLAFALGDLESRFAPLGVGWADVKELNLYSVHDLHRPLLQGLSSRAGADCAVTCHAVRPPVVDLEIELDARRHGSALLLPRTPG